MKPICVASVYANDNVENQKWLDLQLWWLGKTTPNAEHHAIIMEQVSAKGEASFREKTNVIIPDRSPYQVNRWPPKSCHAHLRGLHTIVDFFKKNIDDYDSLLILDSDAFPVMPNWAPRLKHMLQNTCHGKDIAIPLRFEHIENRLHACVLFCLPHAVDNLDFQHRKMPSGDMLGLNEHDTTIGAYQDKLRNRAFPMLNSNQHKVHPLMCMLYYNMFYHHGAGSRPVSYRGTANYWTHVLGGYVVNTDLVEQQRAFTEQLFEDSPKFIQYLRGWSR